MWTVIILIAILAYTAYVLYKHIKGKKEGFDSCGENCYGCVDAPFCEKDLYKEYMKDHANDNKKAAQEIFLAVFYYLKL